MMPEVLSPTFTSTSGSPRPSCFALFLALASSDWRGFVAPLFFLCLWFGERLAPLDQAPSAPCNLCSGLLPLLLAQDGPTRWPSSVCMAASGPQL